MSIFGTLGFSNDVPQTGEVYKLNWLVSSLFQPLTHFPPPYALSYTRCTHVLFRIFNQLLRFVTFLFNFLASCLIVERRQLHRYHRR